MGHYQLQRFRGLCGQPVPDPRLILYGSLCITYKNTAVPAVFFLYFIVVFFQKKKQQAGYRKACAEGRVGRPPTKSKDIEQAIELYKSDACTISQITALTGVSKTTLYRVLKEQKVGSPEG